MLNRSSWEQIVGTLVYDVGDINVIVEVQYPIITVAMYTEVSPDLWVHAKGNALCDANDKFSIDFGHNLAYSRALNRLTKRMEHKLVRSVTHAKA